MSGRVHPNLVGWWRMENNLLDSSGNGNNAVVFEGSHNYTDGVFGRCRDYGTGGDLALQGVEFWGSDNAFSFGAWMRTGSTSTSMIPIGAGNDGQNTMFHIILNHNAVNRLRLYIRKNGNSASQILLSEAHPIGPFFHLFATYSDSDGLRGYLNGMEIGSSASASGLFSTLQYGVGFGYADNRGAVANNFSGQLDDIRIYNAALSASDVRRVYQGFQPMGVYA